MKRILIISCSKAKDEHPMPMPAIDRYDGPAFRLIRETIRAGNWPNDVQLLILSPEFGLLTSDVPIPWYDREMTPMRAAALRDEVAGILDERLAGANEVFLGVAGTYHIMLDASAMLAELQEADCVQMANGSIGEQLAQMKEWILQKREENVI